jgi:hypothetical protein
MANVGVRKQVRNTVTRTGSTTTSTFRGTVGGALWTGALQMTNGTQALNLRAHSGTHRFNIQFTASQTWAVRRPANWRARNV